MTEPSFFPPPEAMTVAEIAALTGAVPVGTDGAWIGGFAASRRSSGQAGGCGAIARAAASRSGSRPPSAGVCFVRQGEVALVPAATVALVTGIPIAPLPSSARHLFPAALKPRADRRSGRRFAAAHVAATARLEEGVTVDAFAVIGPGAEIGGIP